VQEKWEIDSGGCCKEMLISNLIFGHISYISVQQ